MRRLYLAFLRGLSANLASRLGVILTTSAFLLFVLFQLGSLAGWVTNAYVGLILYLALPALFVLGLVLIPVGWWRFSREQGRPFNDLFAHQFSDRDLAAREAGSNIVRILVLLTLMNVVFMGVVGTSTLHFMDQAHFCGTACHSVMNPEWVTYQDSPHARVACVECHVGEGLVPLFKSKLNGAWQMVSASFDLYERPIPTPVHNLRPARETCEHCHWPDKFLGDRVVNRVSFQPDSANTPRYTTLMMKIGSGSEGHASGAHWHVAAANEVRYASVRDEREEMIWVEVRREDGSWQRYENTDHVASEVLGDEHIRVMDCVDCHNRATHIYEQPGPALDERMARGEIDPSLPYIKQYAMAALLGSYPNDPDRALSMLAAGLRNRYRREHAELFPARDRDLERAIGTVQGIYARNIHAQMNIGWEAYPSHLGHQEGEGCFRCHSPNLVAVGGEGAESGRPRSEASSISMDCTLCHSILADDAARPFAYLDDPVGATPADSAAHQALHDEFWRTVTEPAAPARSRR